MKASTLKRDKTKMPSSQYLRINKTLPTEDLKCINENHFFEKRFHGPLPKKCILGNWIAQNSLHCA